MDFPQFQDEARKTSQWSGDREKAVLIALLGLSGEVGSLLSEYKKRLRDGDAHQEYRNRIAEELGDVLWYVAEVASCLDFDLEEVAINNLQKIKDRWGDDDAGQEAFSFASDYYDEAMPEDQQIPRRFTLRIEEYAEANPPQVVVLRDGRQCGNNLTDNSYDDDGYRFHDVFHLAYAAILRWSPVSRKLLGCKRKSHPKIDEVQDGGRAMVIEEGIAAFVFDYARRHSFFETIDRVDTNTLRTIKSLVSGLEVRSRSAWEWEQAILAGYEVWRLVRENRGGEVTCDLESRSITFTSLKDDG